MTKSKKLRKPPSVSSNPFKSKKWDEITSARTFSKSDIPNLEMLCQWYAVVQKCIEDMTVGDDIQVAYTNDLDDLKALPQVGMMKQASAEIRAINKQLGINDQPDEKPEAQVTPLVLIQANRAKRCAGA